MGVSTPTGSGAIETKGRTETSRPRELPVARSASDPWGSGGGGAAHVSRETCLLPQNQDR